MNLPHNRRTGWSLLFAALLLGGCERDRAAAARPAQGSVASPGHPALSPSGKYQLVVIQQDEPGNGPILHFEIQDPQGRRIYQAPERFYGRHQHYFLWDHQDRAWVYSGDVGTYFWERRGESHWDKSAYARSQVPAPAFLKERYPKRFTR
jgi:hypothetical protein